MQSVFELTTDNFVDRYPILPYQKELLAADGRGEDIECVWIHCYSTRKEAFERETNEILEADALVSDRYINKKHPTRIVGDKISEGNKRARLEKPEAFANCNSPEAKKRQSEAHIARHAQMAPEEKEAIRQKKSESMQEYWKDEGKREAQSEKVKESLKERKERLEKEGKPWRETPISDETREKLSEGLKASWDRRREKHEKDGMPLGHTPSDETRAKLTEGQKRRWEDEEARKRQSEKTKASWTPEERAKRSQKMKEAWIKRRRKKEEEGAALGRVLSEEDKAKMAAGREAYMAERKVNHDPSENFWSEESNQKRSASLKESWTEERKKGSFGKT